MFIFRAAFESDYTSLNLHKWVDLIFGINQQGENAEQHDNVYYSICYEKTIKWNEIKSPYHMKSIEIQIAEYGQVPVQIFETPHPKKKIKIPSSLTNTNGYNKNVQDDDKQRMIEQMKHTDKELVKLKNELASLNKAFKSSVKAADTQNDLEGDIYKKGDDDKIESDEIYEPDLKVLKEQYMDYEDVKAYEEYVGCKLGNSE